ncbi:MAG: HupE/UreJ family protein [Rubrivivax sp.]
MRRATLATRRVLTVLAGLAATAAQAHHAMGGATPATAAQGMLSGLAHPVIEVDHLLFLLGTAVWVAASGVRHRLALAALALFAACGAAGTLLHARGVTLPAAEAGVALTLLLMALALWRARAGDAAVLLAAVLGGLLHGYAYGESIVGAEPRPLDAYLIGLALVQVTLMWAVHEAWLALARRADAARRLRRWRQGLAIALGLAGAWVLGTGL